MDYYRTIVSATITGIAYQGFGFGAFVSLIPLLSIKKNIAKYFWLWGLTFMGILHAFFVELHTVSSIPLAITLWLIPTLYYSIFYFLLGIVIQASSKRFNHVLLVPILFFIFETLKSMGTFGNTLGNIGYSLAPYAKIIPSFSLIGTSGIGVAIVLVNAIILKIIHKNKTKQRLFQLAILFCLLFFGSGNYIKDTKSLITTVVHTHIPQIEKINRNNWQKLENNYLNLITKSPSSLIILNETIIPTLIEGTNFFTELNQISTTSEKAILFGAHIKKQTNYYNGSILLEGNRTQYYFKERLMPFGEYLPFRKILDPLIPKELNFQDFNSGKQNSLSTYKEINIGQRICLEGIYSYTNFQSYPDIIIIMANNAWFNDSSASQKLIQFAQAHSAEIGRPTLISSNYGYSAMIDNKGSIQRKSKKNTANIMTETIKVPSNQTIYSRFPFGFISILIILFIVQELIFNRKVKL